MNSKDILLATNAKLAFLVHLQEVAKRRKDAKLASSVANVVGEVLPAAVRDYKLASEAAISDIKKETASKAAKYCGRTI